MRRHVDHPRDEITRVMHRIYSYQMTTTSGGNLSIRDDDGDIWISPARVDKGNLTRDDIVCVRSDGSTSGLHPPSSELPFHQAIYDARDDIRAIVHAHPVALVAFSISRSTPDTRLFHQAHSVCGKVGFAPYALPGSDRLGANISATFRHGCDSVILENHGVVVGGECMSSAFERFEGFEFAAKTLLKARQLGAIRYLSDAQLAQAQRRRIETTSFNPARATPEECELRRQLRDFLHRGCRQRLFISTEGSFSARVGDDAMLITPSGRDRATIGIDDFVLVRGDNAEEQKRPSRATRSHQAIYDAHPDVKSIVFAHPVNATAFSITDSYFDARTIPESYVFLRDVARVPFGIQHQPNTRIADFVSSASPAAILENDGVLVTGSSVLDAFDRLEVLESTADAVISACALGEVKTMSDAVIEELKRAFALPS